MSSKAEDKLLFERICSFDFDLSKSPYYKHVEAVLGEWRALGFCFEPKVYFADDWFSPEQTLRVAIPLCFASHTLLKLEKKMLLEVEGEGIDDFKRLIRHEFGHVFDSAYSLSKKREWKRIFGNPKQNYDPSSYKPQPFSKSFVRHLPNWYAQAHPDEDFAETFAVFMDPNSDWNKKYKSWPLAYQKLEYVQKAVSFYSSKKPLISFGPKLSEAKKMRRTFAAFFNDKKKNMQDSYPAFFDSDLQKLFNQSEGAGKKKAKSFLKKNKKNIVKSVSFWTKEKKVTISSFLDRLIKRVDTLGLYAPEDSQELNFHIACFLTKVVTNYQFTGKFQRNV